MSKPRIRVKAICKPSLGVLLRRAADAYERMTLDQRKAMWQAQRRSWVIGEMLLDHPEMSRKDVEALLDEANLT